MNMPTSTPPFQFRIEDCWVLLGLITASYFTYPWLLSNYRHVSYQYASEACFRWHLFVITILGWFLILRYLDKTLKTGWKRVWALSFYLIPVLFAATFVALPFQRLRLVVDESRVIAICKTIHASEKVYFQRHQVYARSLFLLYADGLLGDETIHRSEAGPTAVPIENFVFEILKAQGPGAPGGARKYTDDKGRLTQGFAIAATPTEYCPMGCNHFIVGPRGIIYQRDTGDSTRPVVFDPEMGGIWIASE